MEKYKDIAPQDILSEEERSRYVLVDVRTDEEFNEGHMPLSKHIPIDQLENRCNELDENKENQILLICRSGARSAMAAEYLFDQGFSRVFNLAGGLMEWTGPVEN